ncbi:MAG: PorT family protein [Bacteroidales bacterium]|nr:PorT family protein [Bacteroidales bacterium]
MKTKLITIIAFLLLSASMANAQIADKAKLSFTVLGGINFSNLTGTDYAGDQLENNLLVGYHVGVNVQIPLVPQFYFQPGFVFNTKGAKKTVDPVTSTYKLSYIELPLNFLYKGLLGNGHVIVGFGPYIGYAIGGKVVSEGGAVSLETDIEFKNPVEAGDPIVVTYFKPIDIGGNVFAGYEMAGGLFAQMNGQLGMIKINPEDKRIAEGKTAIKNTGFGFSVGYRF